MAGEVGLKDITLGQAFLEIQKFLDPVLSGDTNEKHWDSANWSWK
jgi:hypothetical protein